MIGILFLVILVLMIVNLCLLSVEFIMGFVRRSQRVVPFPVPFRDFPHEEGVLELGHGHQEIFVPTPEQPTRVWLCFDDFEGVQCCHGRVNLLSSYSTPEGFVVIANIHSESATVKWIADFV